MLNYARNLRKNATGAERRLWGRLRRRQVGGFKFRRQHLIGPYICDFVSMEGRIVVELDGSQHLNEVPYDSRREAYLKAQGFRTLRFWNAQVMSELESVLDTIFEALHRPEMQGRFD
jgi:very-short-patch-repair endonuclease